MKPWLAFLILLSAGGARRDDTRRDRSGSTSRTVAAHPEKTISGSVDVGYRWRSGVGGSLDTYRTVVNLGSGLRLMGLDLSLESAARRWFDRINVRASNWGGDPYNTAHVDASRHDWYNFSFDYRNIAYFNFLPSYADPTIGQGILSRSAFVRHAPAHERFRAGSDARQVDRAVRGVFARLGLRHAASRTL